MVNNHEMQRLICMELVNKFECQFEECKIVIRRTRERRDSLKFDKASLYITKLDDIHSYFLQFSHNIHFYFIISLCLHTTTDNKEKITLEIENVIHKITSNNILHSSSMIYGCNPDADLALDSKQNEQYITPKSIVNDQNEIENKGKMKMMKIFQLNHSIKTAMTKDGLQVLLILTLRKKTKDIED